MLIDTENFPLVKVDVGEKYITEIEEITELFESLFLLSKHRNMKMSILLDCSKCEGISPFVVAKFVKFLLKIRPQLEKYFNRTSILTENDSGLFSMILSLYTPVRPLKIFNCEDPETAIKWCCDL
jgi:hypothetical protein